MRDRAEGINSITKRGSPFQCMIFKPKILDIRTQPFFFWTRIYICFVCKDKYDAATTLERA